MKRQKVINYGKSDASSGEPAKKKLAVPSKEDPSKPIAKVVSSSLTTKSSPQKSSLFASNSKPSPKSTASAPAQASTTADKDDEIFYAILWRVRSGKVHKTYDNGTMSVVGNRCKVFDDGGKQIATSIVHSAAKLSTLKEEDKLDVGDKELVVNGRISKAEASESKTQGIKEEEESKPSTSTFTSSKAKAAAQNEKITISTSTSTSTMVSKLTSQSKGPLHASSTAPLRVQRTQVRPIQDSKDSNSVVLFTAPENHPTLTDVVLEPFLRDMMRPHQIEGIRFLYECVTGQRSTLDGTPTSGCILADVMGLGKTFQSIALLRTLTRLAGGTTLVKKALVVTPNSLVAPWAKEVTKWLGRERMAPVAISEVSKSQTIELLKRFTDSIEQKLLIISYEQVRIHIELLRSIKFGIIICDEGHRLKNPNSKLSQDLLSLEVPRRVILTGTPFQNNLGEYYALVDFVNPGSLGSIEEFKREFDRPIAASRLPDASSTARELGARKSLELIESTSPFILRRTSKVLEAFLPQKHEIVVFCKPTLHQILTYNKILQNLGVFNENLDEAIEDETVYDINGSAALGTMMLLSKVCNHPSLILPKNEEDREGPLHQNVLDILQNTDTGMGTPETDEFVLEDARFSGKVMVLEKMLETTRIHTKDKVVIVSSFTKTLDLLEKIFVGKKWPLVRLDGSTDMAHRNHAVEKFQRDPTVFLFLLSTKAGGTGLNLFAANRLVLFDSCWNPAFDTQAQARVWRDGQTKETWIYRFLTTGMLDEKIFQRQLVKNEMGRTVLDDEGGAEDDIEDDSSKGTKKSKGAKKTGESMAMARVSTFTPEDLKDIFTINKTSHCDTHDISGCQCVADGSSGRKRPVGSKLSQDEISDWQHLPTVENLDDPILAASHPDQVSFIFSRSTLPLE